MTDQRKMKIEQSDVMRWAMELGMDTLTTACRAGWLMKFAQKVVDSMPAQPAGKAVQAIHLTFDYLDNGQLVATYAVPVASQSAPKLYTAPPAQVPDGWISVADRLPEDQDMYLGMLREDNPLGWTWERPVEVAFGYLLHDRQRFSVFDAWTHENVDIQEHMTHWMPLPAAPQPKGDKK